MSLSMLHEPHRRGACPGLSAPMRTGDGLLVRFLPTATISLPAFAGLCAAARVHGNGVIEVTSRGSIQARGLSAASAVPFARAVAALDIDAAEGIPVHCNALTGLDPGEIVDAGALAGALRRALASSSSAGRLAPKISVAIDGGGRPSLMALSADIRLRARMNGDEVRLGVSVAGNTSSATILGDVAPAHGVEAVTRLLGVLVKRGPDMRARDVVASEGDAAFRAAISDLLLPVTDLECEDRPWPRNEREKAAAGDEVIGVHRLRDGTLACGVGLAFGHADADGLEQLVAAAAAAGARGLRAAPLRGLLAIGLPRGSVQDFLGAATRLGFIVRADDLRRRIVACAGAPICASAHLASRALAPLIAASVAGHGVGTIHVSGCRKGCARAAAAALTVVGTPDGAALIANGTAHDQPFAVIAADELPQKVRDLVREPDREAEHV